MKILDAIQTAQALPYAKLVPAVAQAMRELSSKQIRAPERQVVPIDDASVLLSMPAIAADISVTKLITVHANNARHGLPAIQGEVVAFDTDTGRRLALLDGPTVTARRTAAVTMQGILTLLPRKPLSALLIGSGTQSAEHVDALVEFFGIARIYIAGRNLAAASALCERARARHAGLQMTAVTMDSLADALPETDVVIALTTSRRPVIPAHIASSTLAIGVGAFKPDMAEFPPHLLHGRAIYVDDLDGAKHEAGDLLQAGVDWAQVRPLAAVLEGEAVPAGPVPVFKTVGQAAWDLAAARVALAAL